MGPHDFSLEEERRIWLEGVRLFNAGEFFEAHETWEDAWHAVRDKRREQFYRAIIQAAVTLELLRRGRAVGVRQVFVSSLALFEGLPETFMGVNVPQFCAKLRSAIEPAAADLAARHVRIEPQRLFQIDLEYDAFDDPRSGEVTR